MVVNNKENSLIERKRINNLPKYSSGLDSKIIEPYEYTKVEKEWEQLDKTPESPSNKPSFGDVAEKIGMGVQSVASLAGNLANTANSYKTKELLLAEARRGLSSIGGVSYETMSPNYKCGKMPKYMDGTQGAIGGLTSGAAAGSMFGPIGMGVGAVAGGILGGIFGNAAKKKEQEQKRLAELSMSSTNDFNRSVAHTTAMINQQALLYGNSESQLLHAFNCGKNPKYNDGKNYRIPTISFSPLGAYIDPNKKPTAYVSSGEKVGFVDGKGDIISMFLVPGPKNNRDNVPVTGINSLNAFVISNKDGLSEEADYNPYAALARLYADKKSGKLKKNNLGYASGKISAWPGAAVAGLGALTGLAQYLGAKKETPYRPDTYYDNPYENTALSTLAGIRMNELPIINQLRSAEARGNYALNNSGGLSGAQRYLGKIANIRNTQDSIAQALAQLQQQNNQYRTNYASTLMLAGAQKAANLAAARRYDDDVYMKSHAARQQGMQTGMYNFLNNIQQYVANEFKRRQFNNMYDLYAQDVLGTKNSILNKKPSTKSTTKKLKVFGNPTGGEYGTIKV